LRERLQREHGDARLIETHISWVLLAGDDAWKIKRPVRLPFVDFSALQTRRRLAGPARALRRVAQHLQTRDAPRRRPRTRALRASQRRNARVGPGASGAATRAAPAWTAGADRRLDGHRLVRDGRDGAVAYKDVAAVVDAAHAAGLARKAAKLTPLVCIKG